MPLRTFDIDCPNDSAANELPMPPTDFIHVDGFHPAAIEAGGQRLVLCVHDEDREEQHLVAVPKVTLDAFCDEDEEFHEHLARVLNAELN